MSAFLSTGLPQQLLGDEKNSNLIPTSISRSSCSNMRDLMRETAFGRFANFASRGKIFLPTEQLDPSLLDKYREANPALTSRTSIEGDANVITGIQSLEKGKDIQLVDWEPNDPEVRRPPPQYSKTILIDCRILGIGQHRRKSSSPSRSVS
jgi:hypothetical protein